MRRRALLLAILALPLGACEGERPPAQAPAAPRGRLVIDVRAPEAFAAGHHAGALNLQLGWAQLGARAPSYVPDRGQPLAVFAQAPDEAAAALGVLRRLGYRDVSLATPPDLALQSELWSAARLRAELAGPAPPIVIDVRSAPELLAGGVPGALPVEQDQGPSGVADLDRQARYAVICEGGWRSSQLASWMEREGFTRVANVIDGMAGWRRLEPGGD